MLKTKIILFIITVFSIGVCSAEQSKYYYIDSIDEIKQLEEIGNQYLSFGDTLNAIEAFIQIADKAQLSDIYSDIFISDYLYKIGDLYLLMNDSLNAEKYLLLSIERHNQNKIKNQLLMGDPLFSLKKLYASDSLKFQTVVKQINQIKKIENSNLPDSLKSDLISFDSFNQNLDQESEYFIYQDMEAALIAFDNSLYAQSTENLIKSLSFESTKFTFKNYYEHSLKIVIKSANSAE